MARLSNNDRQYIHAALNETHSDVKAYDEFAQWKRVFTWKVSGRLGGYTKHEKRILALAQQYIADIKSNDELLKSRKPC